MYPDIRGCLRGGSLLLIRRLVDLHGWAGAHKVLVAVDVINPGDAWPEFGLGPNERLQRKDKYYIWLVYTEEKLVFRGGGDNIFFLPLPSAKETAEFLFAGLLCLSSQGTPSRSPVCLAVLDGSTVDLT